MGASNRHHALITGGAGFIGSNLAHRLLTLGYTVSLFDNLSRPGVEQNVAWLRSSHNGGVMVHVGDVRNTAELNKALANVSLVFHFASQVAVTKSLGFPVEDFEINLRGTLNLLELLRSLKRRPLVIYLSTNKVYGQLKDIRLEELNSRYIPEDMNIRFHGIGEERCVDFETPYGCSKGSAEQYVLSYARAYDVPAVVFRLSCIYGRHQMGNEDQGWVSHFLLRTLSDQPITIFGDGKQVRDVLYIEDLLDVLVQAISKFEILQGKVFNIGGGPENTLSLLELIDLIDSLNCKRPLVNFGDRRFGDQLYYVSDIRRFQGLTRWRPTTNVKQGVTNLYSFLKTRWEVP